MQVKKQQLELGMEQQTGSKLGKKYIKAVRQGSTQPQVGRWHHPNGRKQRGTKELLDEGEREVWKSWLKTQHSKTDIIASRPITSWQIDGEAMETVTDFISLGCKIIADGACNHEI